MAKIKRPTVPAFGNSETRVDGKTRSRTYYDSASNTLINEFLPDFEFSQLTSGLKSKLKSLINSLNGGSAQEAKSLDEAQQAYIDSEKEQFNDEYEPELRKLREDTAARFGSLASSDFADRLEDLETGKAKAFADIVRQGKLLRNQMESDAQNQKLSTINALSGVLDSQNTQAIDYAGLSMSASSYLNSFLRSDYEEQLKKWEDDKNKFKLFWF